ncbi:LytTR family two component transcriptional regulator [Arcicella aurantiaca]|uniref:LytTR family two component transcriptional regulator n=1 Tax=Arcicella aurantiaca TaxID=591202 RepID=A0A316EK03_9BACT|nr:LytTR family DNA-binding domain-containing protein [Arcicella aurantiaca]PWK29222.1 LytTR family two component transcriptional regulator [Arcicella aurantiaca]
MFSAIIIDDESHARESLSTMLSLNCPDIQILGTASSASEGFQMITKHNPDLIFLDIEMPNGTGFDLLTRFVKPTFKVVFVTGFDQYALNAIKFSALDYLLKPINANELKEAVEKAKLQMTTQNGIGDLKNLLSTLQNPRSRKNKLAIPTQQGLEMIEIQEIIHCEAANGYTIIHLQEGKPLMSSRDLKTYQELLEDYDFYRIHDSHLIAHFHVQKVLNEDGGVAVMSNDSKLPIARRRKSDFMDWLKTNN